MTQLYVWVDSFNRIHYAGAIHPEAEEKAQIRNLTRVPIDESFFNLIEHVIIDEGILMPKLSDLA